MGSQASNQSNNYSIHLNQTQPLNHCSLSTLAFVRLHQKYFVQRRVLAIPPCFKEQKKLNGVAPNSSFFSFNLHHYYYYTTFCLLHLCHFLSCIIMYLSLIFFITLNIIYLLTRLPIHFLMSFFIFSIYVVGEGRKMGTMSLREFFCSSYA